VQKRWQGSSLCIWTGLRKTKILKPYQVDRASFYFQRGEKTMIMRDKSKSKKGYAIVPTTLLRDKKLTANAKGIASFIISCKDDFQLNDKSISIAMGVGITVATSGIKNLRALGYVIENEEYSKTKGKKPLDRYIFYENPTLNSQNKKSQSNISEQENLNQEKMAHININSNKYQEINNDYININQSIPVILLPDEVDYSETTKRIKENISYEHLKTKHKNEIDEIDGIMNTIVLSVNSTKSTLRVRGEEMPKQVVISQLLKLEEKHIEYVLRCLESNTTEIKNINSYILTALFNAPQTYDQYWKNQANFDIAKMTVD
jgi:hypothetical protein